MTTWQPFGDVGLFAEFGAIETADAWEAALSHLEVRRGWSSLLVFGDPTLLQHELAGIAPAAAAPGIDVPTVVVPVVYDGDDLAEVADRTGLTVAEVVARHTATEYRSVMLGFTGGFAYLSGLDPALRLPRRATPRLRVPAGSVAIAGEQAGIYPNASPGGWHLLGHTDLCVFDPDRSPPALLVPGTPVRFEAWR
jgi:KipI family sensor histidine kinase inhibitor